MSGGQAKKIVVEDEGVPVELDPSRADRFIGKGLEDMIIRDPAGNIVAAGNTPEKREN